MTRTLRSAVVVGNPKARSRTLTAAEYVGRELTGADPDLVVDLVDLGAALLDPRDAHVERLVETITRADVVVFASPTYKAAYTGLLKLFLDRIPGRGLDGVVAVPLMLGAGPGHALAVETALRPVLTELGALVPARGLYVLDRDHDDPEAYHDWLAGARPVVMALVQQRVGVS